MPELVEVEKMRRMLGPAWKGLTLVDIWKPKSDSSRKGLSGYLKNETGKEFLGRLKKQRVEEICRRGKKLYVVWMHGGGLWEIQLNSTGWFMPRNVTAVARTAVDPIWTQFLHPVTENTVRLVLEFSDGSSWEYHDSRTWGKWFVRGYNEMDMTPDWLWEATSAHQALLTYKGRRRVRDVLCDQKLAQGVGYYMSCELAHKAGIHPHQRWNQLSPELKSFLLRGIPDFISLSLQMNDHSHWRVFAKAGQDCKSCKGGVIRYVKDEIRETGSYYCSKCQPFKEGL